MCDLAFENYLPTGEFLHLFLAGEIRTDETDFDKI